VAVLKCYREGCTNERPFDDVSEISGSGWQCRSDHRCETGDELIAKLVSEKFGNSPNGHLCPSHRMPNRHSL